MIAIKWDESFSVGVETLDRQHKLLFALINQFHRAVEAKEDTPKLTSIFSQVVAYTGMHFSKEEEMMRQANYPDLENHMVLHARLVEEAKKNLEEIQSGKNGACENAVGFLANWLEKHIKGVDTKYAPHVRGEAV